MIARLKRAEVLREERLELLLRLLRERGPVSVSALRSEHGLQRWEVKAAGLLGWVRFARERLARRGPQTLLVIPEEDTSEARPAAQEWEVPFEIPEGHREFARRTMEIVGFKRDGAPVYKTLAAAYRESFPRSTDRCQPNTARLLRCGTVQAVRAWLLAQTCGDIDADEEMPDTVGGIEFRLRGAGWTDGRFAWAREVGRRKAAGREMEVERGDAPSVLQETLKWLDAETRRVEQQREQIPEAGLEKERSLELRAVPVAKREGGVLRGPLGGIGVPRTRASPLAA